MTGPATRPTRAGRWFAIATLTFSGLVFTALLALNLGNHAWYRGDVASALYHYALPGALAVACFALLAAGQALRLVVAVHLAGAALALYVAEGWITARYWRSAGAVAVEQGRALDRRPKARVVADLRREGHDAYPATRGRALLVPAGDDATLASALRGARGPLLPLASVPEATIVSCNETGEWITFESDEHGFRNPPGTWSRHHTRLALVGDSFVQGDCVGPREHLAAHLGALGPLVNVGVAGFGPLQSLAVVEEYLPLVSPEVVVWFFFEGNDLVKDLPEERRAPVLTAYVHDPRHHQGLAARRGELRAALARHVDARLRQTLEATDHPLEWLMDFARLYRLRERVGLDPLGFGVFDGLADDDFALFRAVLAEAARSVGRWGGRLVFVYLPDSARFYAAGRDSRIRDGVRARVLALVDDLGIPLVDVTDAFARSPDPRALFHHPGSHYNPEGYALAARQVRTGLADLGLAPTTVAARGDAGPATAGDAGPATPPR